MAGHDGKGGQVTDDVIRVNLSMDDVMFPGYTDAVFILYNVGVHIYM